jgi:hypothetical protein
VTRAAPDGFFLLPLHLAATVAGVARTTLGIALAAALLAAGCGVRTTEPFTANGTAGCLKKQGFSGVTMNPLKVGFIAAFADKGGIRATSALGNSLTIAFAADANSTGSTEQAFRSHAPKSLRPHMSDIMQTNRNAVLVWTTTPDPAELDAATRCLKP